MNLKYCWLSSVLLFSHALSQNVVTIPRYSTESDSIIVRFDATQQGAADLLNYVGTVYTHTGVNTNKGNWRYVKGTWANNQTQPALTRLGANFYQLTIGYPRLFYDITDSAEHIEALDFVFRSSDATKQTRPDIFVALYKPGLSVVVG